MPRHLLHLLGLAACVGYLCSASAQIIELEPRNSRFRDSNEKLRHDTYIDGDAPATGATPPTPSPSPHASRSTSPIPSTSASTSPSPSASAAMSPSLSASASVSAIPSGSPPAAPTQSPSTSTSPTPMAATTSSPSPFSVAPGSSPCILSVAISELVKDSYVNHAQLVRQGVPMEIVKSFYEHALRSVAQSECRCGDDGLRIDTRCIQQAFTNDHGLMTRNLEKILALDLSLPLSERLFPRFEERQNLPNLGELERKAIDDGLEASMLDIEAVNETYWNGVVLPSDEAFRYDAEQARACEEFSQRMDKNNLWISATSLTSYVLGMLHQLLLLPKRSEAGTEMLNEHIRMVYLAARCRRLSGDRLRVPVVFLESIIKRTHLALKNSSIGTGSAIIAGFPCITKVQGIADIGRELFPGAIEQMSSLNSFGRAKVLSWNGTDVFMDSLEDVMLANASGRDYNELYNIQRQMEERPVACGVGFTWTRRMREVEKDEEKCCSNGCMRFTGGGVKRSVMNEMCCEACNLGLCNVEDLAQVIDAQSYGFEHARESSVANVW